MAIAADGGRTSIVEYLVEHHADADTTDGVSGRQPVRVLSFTCWRVYNTDAFAVQDGRTPLMLAANRGHIDIVLVLLARGVNVHAKASCEVWTC